MRVRRALNLSNFDHGFVAHTLGRVLLIDIVYGPVGKGEHGTVGAVTIVRNRQTFYTLPTQDIHPVPETFGIDAVQAGKLSEPRKITLRCRFSFSPEDGVYS